MPTINLFLLLLPLLIIITPLTAYAEFTEQPAITRDTDNNFNYIGTIHVSDNVPVRDAGTSTPHVQGDVYVITENELNQLMAMGNSPKELGHAPHLSGTNMIKYSTSESTFTFEGADIDLISQTNGDFRITGTATDEIMKVFCHGDLIQEIPVSGNFDIWVNGVSLYHQFGHVREQILSYWAGDWYFELVKTHRSMMK